MNRQLPIFAHLGITGWLLGICLYPLLGGHLLGQSVANPPVSGNPAMANVPHKTVTVATPARSPVDFFRELLAMDESEREERLAGRDPADRKAILAKLEDYSALSPEDREVRLTTTQLHWYMMQFINSSATNRAAFLASIPEADRPMVEARANQWVILPPPLQAEILEYESTSRYFFVTGHTATNTPKVLHNLPDGTRREVEERLARWNALSQEERQRLTTQFEQVFELTLGEKEKTLSSLSEPERKQLENTLAAYQQLPKATRELCLQSFGRFARMTAYQQQQFLKNVERWRAMSPSERNAWQRLVHYLASTPPMPEGVDPLPDYLRIDPNLAAPGTPDQLPLATNSLR